ncbi:PEP-CTERM sorting domain-containing protein [Massilia sp. IC2-278]|uniref:PEP-CTERM sorting domain-containing protein n=1 Tax=Massilia sp. IC2-278 TaxID=2887200 RepID=UPI001E381576|nr:PEP-CTERM sorting domain-containing protein [Massilia sp. IC2-278]MCC2960802.1 PEP-CTERM sorting domain-containing protein [Massilia sp. IC2-278]
MKRFAPIAASLLFAFSASANAGIVVAHDNFDGANTGFNAGWATDITSSKNKPTLTTTAGNKSLTFGTNHDRAAYWKLAETQTGGIIVDFSFSYTGKLGNNNFMGLWLGDANGPSFGLKSNCDTGVCTDDLYVRTLGSNTSYLLGSDLVAGQSYHLLGYLSKTDGSEFYNSFAAWMNPTAYEMTSLTGADRVATGASKISSVSEIGIRTAFLEKGVKVSIDNLRVSEVPEPATLSLFGLALAGLGLAGRRKRG